MKSGAQQILVDTTSLQAARQKYLQLGREIEELPASTHRSNLQHTHSKLGIFLEQAVGRKAWRGEQECIAS